MSLGKPTEMSLRDLLVEELKRRDVVVVSDYLYPALAKKIEQLKTLMQG